MVEKKEQGNDWEAYRAVQFEERTSTDLGYTVRYVLIGPEQAKQLLGLNYAGNRSMKTSAQYLYTHEMERGQWHTEVSTPLTISDKGHVLDGQHRLQAIIDSGTEQLVELHEGVSEDMYPFFDKITKRSAADGIDHPNASSVTAAMRLAISIGKNGLSPRASVWNPAFRNPTSAISDEDIITYTQMFDIRYGRDVIDRAIRFSKKCSKKTAEKPESYGGVALANTLGAMAAIITSESVFEEFVDIVFDRNITTNRAINSFRFYTMPAQRDGGRPTVGMSRMCGWSLFAHAWNSVYDQTDGTAFKFFQNRVEEMRGFDPSMFDLGV